MNNLLNNLGLCRKAGNLVLGFDSVKQIITEKKAFLVVMTQDVSHKTKKEIDYWSEKYGIKAVLIPLQMEDTQKLFRKKIGVAAVTDPGFARLIDNNISIDKNQYANDNHQGGSIIYDNKI